MKSFISKIPRFRDVEFVTEEAIAIKSSARKDEERKFLEQNIQFIEENRDLRTPAESPNWIVFPFSKTYRLKALLDLNRFEFVFNVFRALLGRNPSPEEMWTQVEVIRKNKLQKLAYIITLRGFEESRVYNSSFYDADRGIKLFGRFFKIKNLGSIRDIELYVKGSESIFSHTDDLEERLEDFRLNYKSISSYLDLVAESFEAQLENQRVGEKAKVSSRMEENITDSLNAEEGPKKNRMGFTEGDMEEVYFVDPPNFHEIGEKNGITVKAETKEKYPEDYDYCVFENAFYDSEVVQRKQRHYLPFLKRAKGSKRKFLDLGCGRGEFLKILKGYGIEGVGVELNRIECEALRGSKLTVFRKDIFEFIRENEGLWSGVSLLHVIEHLDKEKVVRLFDDLSDMIEPDGTVIIESINPYCPKSFASFYMDPTHIVPYTPEGIAFNLQRAGFTDIKILYSNLIDFFLWGPDKNANYHDFGVIGRKPI